MKLLHTLPQQNGTAPVCTTAGVFSRATRRAMVATALTAITLAPLQGWAASAAATPVPGYVAPVTETPVAAYVDDTRGVYVPPHAQLRQKTEQELSSWNEAAEANRPLYAQSNPSGGQYEKALNTVANGVADTRSELDRIAQDPGLLAGGAPKADAQLYAQDQYADQTASQPMDGRMVAQNTKAPKSLEDYPSLATGGQPRPAAQAAPAVDIGPAQPQAPMASAPSTNADGGIELAVGESSAARGGDLDLQHGIVRLKEERISVRRALQRMLDQVGGSGWTVVWDLDEVNAGLPDMEISIYAEEPFIKVMNALLARLQTRSGQPIRVIKYDKSQRLVITDRTGGDARSGSVGAGGATGAAVTETVLKESTVSLHYDEVPLVDALENIVNQAGHGQWRLRMYAGTDQVLKPAHVEEPFGQALERILKVFNLRYEIFPGGKLIVVTSGSSFGFRGVEQ